MGDVEAHVTATTRQVLLHDGRWSVKELPKLTLKDIKPFIIVRPGLMDLRAALAHERVFLLVPACRLTGRGRELEGAQNYHHDCGHTSYQGNEGTGQASGGGGGGRGERRQR